MCVSTLVEHRSFFTICLSAPQQLTQRNSACQSHLLSNPIIAVWFHHLFLLTPNLPWCFPNLALSRLPTSSRRQPQTLPEISQLGPLLPTHIQNVTILHRLRPVVHRPKPDRQACMPRLGEYGTTIQLSPTYPPCQQTNGAPQKMSSDVCSFPFPFYLSVYS